LETATELRPTSTTLAASGGADDIGFLQSGTGAVARTLQDKGRDGVSVKDFGAVGDGTTDDSAAVQAAVTAHAHVIFPAGTYKIISSVTLPATGITIEGRGVVTLNATVNGEHIFDATSAAKVYIDGIDFVGTSSSTTPLAGFGGYSAANTGLVTCTTCTDVRVTNCGFSTFANGVTTQNCDRVWVTQNRVSAFYIHGILASSSTYFNISNNVVTGCTQTGGVVAYGIHATGDQAGGNEQERCAINFNHISGIASWAGIMTHDCDGLSVIGNDIRDVRKGIDIGHLVATNVVRNIIVANNYVEGTATETWGGGAAETGGIFCAGYDATYRVDGMTITGNIIRDFFGVATMAYGGNPNGITISNADSVICTSNSVLNCGNVVNNAGIGLGGTMNNGLIVSNNNLQGYMGRAAIRFATATAEGVSVGGNVIEQTTSSAEAIYISGSTMTAFALGTNPTNSTAPYAQATSTITFRAGTFETSVTYDPPSLADGAGVTTTVTVSGAAVGDLVVASYAGDLVGVLLTAYVSAANTVSVRFQNETTGTLDLGSATLRARVFKALT
jgi:hypothetical protein